MLKEGREEESEHRGAGEKGIPSKLSFPVWSSVTG